MIKGIAHLAYNAANMDQTLHFYCDILGFTKAFELDDDNGNPWIVYVRVTEGQFIEFFYGNQESYRSVSHPISYSHLCLEVDDIQNIAERLTNFGVALDVPPRQGKDLNFQCWAKDPDGNRIEFMQIHPDSPQKKSIL